MVEEVNEYLFQLPEPTQQVAWRLHGILVQNPGVYSRLRFKIPFYYRHSWFAYINPLRHGALELAFIHGHLLHDETGLLQKGNRKQVAGVRISTVTELYISPIQELIQQALLLDEEKAAQRKLRP